MYGNHSILLVSLAMVASGCSALAQTATLPTAPPCAAAPASGVGGSTPVSVIPESPKIGEAFTVKMRTIWKPGDSDVWPPDGVYKVQIEKVDVDHRAGCGPQFRPAPPNERAEIGTITVTGGMGEATFQLMPDYGNVKPEAGKGIFVYTQGTTGGEGINFVVGHN